MLSVIEKHQIKVQKQKYDVGIIIWEDGYHQCIGYNPIPTTEVRKEIDQNILKSITYKLKNMIWGN